MNAPKSTLLRPHRATQNVTDLPVQDKNGAGNTTGVEPLSRPGFFSGGRRPWRPLAAGAFCLGLAIIAATEGVVRREQADALHFSQQYVETLARSLRDQVDTELAASESLMRVIAVEARQDGLEVAAVRMSRMASSRSGKAADFMLLDAAGVKVWESRETALYPEIVADHLEAHRRSAPSLYMTPASRIQPSDAWAMHFSYPVVNGDGELRGLVMAVFGTGQLLRSYREMNLGRGGELTLLGRDGVLIARVSDGKIVSGHDLSSSGVPVTVQSGTACNTGVLSGPVDGIRRIGSLCVIGSYPLLAGVGLDAETMLAGSLAAGTRYRMTAFLLVALLAAGAAFAAVLMSRQQRTQAALRTSEERYRALNALGSDWYWEADEACRLKNLSEGFSRMTGMSSDMLYGKRVWDGDSISPVGSDWNSHRDTIERRVPFRDLALRFISPQGIVAYGSVSGEPMFGADGRLKGYQGVCNDITAEIILRRRLRMQHDVTRILSQETDASRAIRSVLETICRTMEWSWGAHWHFDPVTMQLTCREYWLAPDVKAEAFVEFAKQPKKGDPERGSVCRAIVSGQVVWFTNHSPQGLRRSALAADAGLRGAVVVPVPRSRGLEHAMEFFSERVEAPDQVTLDTLESISREVGQFLDRAEAQLTSSLLERQRRHLVGRLELQLQQMPVACLLQDENFRTVYCNPAAEKMFGYGLQELQGRDVAEIITPDSLRAQVWARRSRLQAGDLDVSGTNEIFRKNGERIICDWNNTPLFDESGRFAGVLATAQDVTERMNMVAALEASELRYRQIFESAPLPMWVAETGVPKFLAVNDAMVEKYGYSRDELLGMSAVDLQLAEDREKVGRQLLERDPAASAHYERRHVTKSGRLLLVEITAHPFQFSGKPARLVIATDVTERKMAQLALQESEARFRAVFEQASVGIALRELTERPRFLRVNQKLCEILGYSESELLQKTTTELTVNEDLDSTIDLNRQLMSGLLTTYARRKRYRRKDGRPIWVNLSVSRLTGASSEEGNYLISVVQDITEQVENEARVQESEARYRQVFSLAPLPMQIHDDSTMRFIDMNDASLAMYGYTREEMLALTTVDIQPLEERESYLREIATRNPGEVKHVQKRHRCKNGRLIDVEVYSCLTRLGGRDVRLVLIRDMSEQLRAERLLRESERRVALALEASAGALFDWNVATGSVYLSDHWNVMLGGDAREIEVTFGELEQMVHPEDRPRQREQIVALFKAAGRPHLNEFRVRNHRGEWIWIESRASVTEFDESGRALQVVGTNVDITQRKLAEITLRERDIQLRQTAEEVRKLNAELEQRVEQRTQALAAANRELESFSYSVSHDLRAPLRTIDGFSQILLDEYSGRIDDVGRGYLERVRAGSQRMAKLIDDLLELARVTRRDLNVRECDLTAMAEEIARELATADPLRSVHIEVARGMTVAADSGLLRIALDNLLRNAWKFTGLRPEALIEVGRLPSDGGGATYFVRDNGVGFDMAYAGKLFGAFQRLHSEAEFQGTGIGLALVQRVIRRHGGKVWAEAQPGAGATFYFTLPAMGVDDMLPPQPQAPTAAT